MEEEIKWRCPQCKMNEYSYESNHQFYGFFCLCSHQDLSKILDVNHGLTLKNPCPNAECENCGWKGIHPHPDLN